MFRFNHMVWWQAGGKHVNEKLFEKFHVLHSPSHHCSSVCQPQCSFRTVCCVDDVCYMPPSYVILVCVFFSLSLSCIPFYWHFGDGKLIVEHTFISKVRQMYRSSVCLRSECECIGGGKFII